MNDLICTKLRRLRKRDLIVIPRRFYHTLRIFFHMTDRTIHHITDTVDQPRFYRHIADRDLCCLTRDKLWLCRCDRLTGSTLRQFIHRLFFTVFLCHMRQNAHIHKSFDKGGFSRSDRSYHANIDLAVCSCLHIFVYIKFRIFCFHILCPRFCLYHVYGGRFQNMNEIL